jgi:hypothetical protein
MIPIVLLSFCFCVLNSPSAFVQTPKQAKIAIGKFVSVEHSDYFYFKIIKSNKTEVSFRVDKTDAFYDKVDRNPQSFIGKKVKIYYEHKKIYTPEAGGDIVVDAYVKAELMK